MPKKPYLSEELKRRARITVLTTERIKSELEIAAERDRRPLSTFCETILIKSIKPQ